VIVARIVQILRGSTWPAVVETDASVRWVMKFAGAGRGPRGLLTEFIATDLARQCGAPVVEVAILTLPDGFPWQIGTDEFDGIVQRSVGANLGLRYLEGGRIATMADVDGADADILARIALVDRLTQNVDRTARNPNLMVDASGALRAIDHDACLFLDRALAQRAPFRFDLPEGHVLANRSLLTPSIPPLDFDVVDQAPESWIAATGLSRTEVTQRLHAYAQAFAAAR